MQSVKKHPMFNKETYVGRRAELKRLVGSGIIVMFGNNESPANFPNNGYYPFRSWATTFPSTTSCGTGRWTAWPTWPPKWA